MLCRCGNLGQHLRFDAVGSSTPIVAVPHVAENGGLQTTSAAPALERRQCHSSDSAIDLTCFPCNSDTTATGWPLLSVGVTLTAR
jgi:hypothetical protein